MINLLPPEDKKEIRAGRANTLLRRYIFWLLLVGLVLAAITGYFYWQLMNEQTRAEQVKSDNQQKLAKYQSVINESNSFQKNLATAKKILSKKVDYTGIILKIAGIMPANTVLSSLSLDPATIGKETQITARAKSYEDAIALKDAMQKSGLFTDVHFLKISQSQDAGSESQSSTPDEEYGQEIVMSVKFNEKVIR